MVQKYNFFLKQKSNTRKKLGKRAIIRRNCLPLPPSIINDCDNMYRTFLTRIYPFKQSRRWLRDSIVYGVAIWAILYLLQPFGFSMYSGNKCLAAALFGLVTLVCYATYGLAVIRPLNQHIRPWRIWHQGCLVLGLILFIALCNFLLFSVVFHCPITLQLFLLFLRWTLIIGIIITALSIGIEYNQSLRDRMEALLSNTAEEQKDIAITIHDNNVRGNDLTIPINDLLYIEAQKNNVVVGYMKDGELTTAEVHTTLTAAIEDLKDYENIFQCHRSFVVNVNNITSAKGNSNGYQLRLATCASSIPVSRSYVAQLKSFIA